MSAEEMGRLLLVVTLGNVGVFLLNLYFTRKAIDACQKTSDGIDALSSSVADVNSRLTARWGEP